MSELNEQDLQQVTGGSAEPSMTVTFVCKKCGKQKKVTYSETPENPTCCGEMMVMVGGITGQNERDLVRVNPTTTE